jgi:hypothetical protein
LERIYDKENFLSPRPQSTQRLQETAKMPKAETFWGCLSFPVGSAGSSEAGERKNLLSLAEFAEYAENAPKKLLKPGLLPLGLYLSL